MRERDLNRLRQIRDGSRYEEPRFFYRGSERRLIQSGLIRSDYIAGIGADFTKLTITEAGREVLRKRD